MLLGRLRLLSFRTGNRQFAIQTDGSPFLLVFFLWTEGRTTIILFLLAQPLSRLAAWAAGLLGPLGGWAVGLPFFWRMDSSKSNGPKLDRWRPMVQNWIVGPPPQQHTHKKARKLAQRPKGEKTGPGRCKGQTVKKKRPIQNRNCQFLNGNRRFWFLKHETGTGLARAWFQFGLELRNRRPVPVPVYGPRFRFGSPILTGLGRV